MTAGMATKSIPKHRKSIIRALKCFLEKKNLTKFTSFSSTRFPKIDITREENSTDGEETVITHRIEGQTDTSRQTGGILEGLGRLSLSSTVLKFGKIPEIQKKSKL